MLGVYKIVFLGGEFYIGSAYGKKGFDGRWEDHKKSRRSSPKYLQETAQKYGGWRCVEFVILKEAKNKHRTLLWEQAYINKNKNNTLLLNKNRNVFGPPDWNGQNNPMWGKHQTKESREKISKARKGKPKSEETKKKMSVAKKGFHHSEEARKKMSEASKGRHHSEEIKKRISESSKGKSKSAQHKKRIGEGHAGEKSGMSKLTWIKVREIREKYKTIDNVGKKIYTQQQLADEYFTVIGNINLIVNNKAWKENERDI